MCYDSLNSRDNASGLTLILQRASGATWNLAAVLLAKLDKLGVEIVKEWDIRRKVFVEKSLNMLIGGVFGNDPDSREYPFFIGVHHEERKSKGIQQDGVRSLRTDAVYGE